MSTDPYAAPRSNVDVEPGALHDAAFVPGGQHLEAGRGVGWLTEGFALFRRQPGMWIALFLLYIVIFGSIGAVPILGSLVTLIFGPVLAAGVVVGSRAVERGEPLEVPHLFAGFKEKTGPLVSVGALYLAGWMIIGVIVVVLAGAGAAAMYMGGGTRESMGVGAMLGVGLAVLIAVVLSFPLVMAAWFAAPLVMLHDLPPLEAMKASLAGCLKNVFPFILYSLVIVVLGVLATVPLLLGWLVLGPVLAASYYLSYRDIFTAG